MLSDKKKDLEGGRVLVHYIGSGSDIEFCDSVHYVDTQQKGVPAKKGIRINPWFPPRPPKYEETFTCTGCNFHVWKADLQNLNIRDLSYRAMSQGIVFYRDKQDERYLSLSANIS